MNMVQTKLKSEAPTQSSVNGMILQRKCSRCSSHNMDGERQFDQSPNLQRRAANEAGLLAVPPIVHDVLRSPGEPLDRETRAFMEPRFGHDFSRVRIHTDEKAAESARAVNAYAYTVGQDVVFGARRFQPRTSEGRRLLAHELTHVVQESKTEFQIQQHMNPITIMYAAIANSKLNVGELHDEYEREADAVADRVIGMNLPSVPEQFTVKGAALHTKTSTLKVMRTPSFKDCSSSQQKTILAAISRGRGWVSTALSELKGALGGTISSHLGSVLDRNFHTRTTSDISKIIDGFNKIDTALKDSLTYECESWCMGEKCGYVYALWTNVHFCPSYFGSSSTTTFQARCLIHELAHKEAGAGGDTYVYDPGYSTLTPSQAIKNADSYAIFAQEI